MGIAAEKLLLLTEQAQYSTELNDGKIERQVGTSGDLPLLTDQIELQINSIGRGG